MQFTLSTIAAVAALLGSASAHMTLKEPPQWKVPGEPLAPLEPDGSNYPCQGGVADPTAAAEWTAGSSAQIVVQGSAVHGGGSGQMAITYDFPPTADSVWRVMTSWEGDHPIKAENNLPADPTLVHPAISLKVPSGLPSGRAVVAWNWFNRKGNREHYMKCATVNIKSSNSVSGNANSDASMLALPTAFRANSGNGCEVPEGVDAIGFKNPGANVIVASGYKTTPVSCDSTKAGSGSGGSGGSSTGGETSPAPSASSTPKGSSGNNSGDNSDDSAPKPSPTYVPKPSATKPAATKVVETAPAATATSGSSASGPCEEGKVVCNADGTWSQCGSGVLQLQGKITPGMVCKDGVFSAAKRSIRFSSEHMRRRH